MTSLLEAQGVAIEGRLHPTDLDVEAGSLVALIGANGSGKTSLLRALAGVELSGGRVFIDGEDGASAPPARRPHLLTFLPASRDLIWPIRAREIIAMGLPTDDSPRVDLLLDQLELRPLAARPVTELSTGERARVLLARAMAPSPRLLLLDEPLSNLDPYWVLRTIELLRDTVREAGCSAVVSLHDIDRASSFDRALLVDRGRIAADLAPAAMLASAELSRSFRIKKGNSGWRISPAEGPRSSP
ncbi:MAG: ABC transporter ATP-binding protein [Sphingomonas sp.]|nr:ABC transporter ATP-binding protein [Sphingomonas sp.]